MSASYADIRDDDSIVTSKSMALPDIKVGSVYFVYVLGILTSLAGQFIGWNQGLVIGFWSYTAALTIVSSFFLCFTMCHAEMISVLPFPGGSYGIVRLTLGTYFGFLIGCCESMLYIAYCAEAVHKISRGISQLCGQDDHHPLEPLYWLLILALAVSMHFIGSIRTFWDISCVLVTISLGLILIYVLGTAQFMNFELYAMHEIDQATVTADGDVQSAAGLGHGEGEALAQQVLDFFRFMPTAAWFFIGTCVVSLSCKELKEEKKQVPKAMVASTCTLTLLSFVTLLSASAQRPGVSLLPEETFPLSPGLGHLFGMSTNAAVLFSIPALFGMVFGLSFAYSRQIEAMAKSGLYPKRLSTIWVMHGKSPFGALLLGSFCVFILLLFMEIQGNDVEKHIFNVAILCFCAVGFSLLASYIIFGRTYSRLQRNFTNPTRIYGAIYGIFIAAILTISVVALQHDGQFALITFLLYLSAMTVYYTLVAKRRQFFSEEEQAILLVAYIIKSNSRGKAKLSRSRSRRRSAMGQISTSFSIRASASIRGSAFYRMSSTLSTYSGTRGGIGGGGGGLGAGSGGVGGGTSSGGASLKLSRMPSNGSLVNATQSNSTSVHSVVTMSGVNFSAISKTFRSLSSTRLQRQSSMQKSWQGEGSSSRDTHPFSASSRVSSAGESGGGGSSGRAGACAGTAGAGVGSVGVTGGGSVEGASNSGYLPSGIAAHGAAGGQHLNGIVNGIASFLSIGSHGHHQQQQLQQPYQPSQQQLQQQQQHSALISSGNIVGVGGVGGGGGNGGSTHQLHQQSLHRTGSAGTAVGEWSGVNGTNGTGPGGVHSVRPRRSSYHAARKSITMLDLRVIQEEVDNIKADAEEEGGRDDDATEDVEHEEEEEEPVHLYNTADCTGTNSAAAATAAVATTASTCAAGSDSNFAVETVDDGAAAVPNDNALAVETEQLCSLKQEQSDDCCALAPSNTSRPMLDEESGGEALPVQFSLRSDCMEPFQQAAQQQQQETQAQQSMQASLPQQQQQRKRPRMRRNSSKTVPVLSSGSGSGSPRCTLPALVLNRDGTTADASLGDRFKPKSATSISSAALSREVVDAALITDEPDMDSHSVGSSANGSFGRLQQQQHQQQSQQHADALPARRQSHIELIMNTLSKNLPISILNRKETSNPTVNSDANNSGHKNSHTSSAHNRSSLWKSPSGLLGSSFRSQDAPSRSTTISISGRNEASGSKPANSDRRSSTSTCTTGSAAVLDRSSHSRSLLLGRALSGAHGTIVINRDPSNEPDLYELDIGQVEGSGANSSAGEGDRGGVRGRGSGSGQLQQQQEVVPESVIRSVAARDSEGDSFLVLGTSPSGAEGAEEMVSWQRQRVSFDGIEQEQTQARGESGGAVEMAVGSLQSDPLLNPADEAHDTLAPPHTGETGRSTDERRENVSSESSPMPAGRASPPSSAKVTTDASTGSAESSSFAGFHPSAGASDASMPAALTERVAKTESNSVSLRNHRRISGPSGREIDKSSHLEGSDGVACDAYTSRMGIHALDVHERPEISDGGGERGGHGKRTPHSFNMRRGGAPRRGSSHSNSQSPSPSHDSQHSTVRRTSSHSSRYLPSFRLRASSRDGSYAEMPNPTGNEGDFSTNDGVDGLHPSELGPRFGHGGGSSIGGGSADVSASSRNSSSGYIRLSNGGGGIAGNGSTDSQRRRHRSSTDRGVSTVLRSSFNTIMEMSSKINIGRILPIQMSGDDEFNQYKEQMIVQRLSILAAAHGSHEEVPEEVREVVDAIRRLSETTLIIAEADRRDGVASEEGRNGEDTVARRSFAAALKYVNEQHGDAFHSSSEDEGEGKNEHTDQKEKDVLNSVNSSGGRASDVTTGNDEVDIERGALYSADLQQPQSLQAPLLAQGSWGLRGEEGEGKDENEEECKASEIERHHEERDQRDIGSGILLGNVVKGDIECR